MKSRSLNGVWFPILFCILGLPAAAQDVPKEYQGVLDALGKKGDYKANALKVNIPRNDLNVTINGTAVPTPFGFGGWIAMTKGDHGMDVMMGDLVLLQEEVNPVMSALLDNGLEVTALHNHFFYEEPRIFYMHVHGFGKPEDLARKVKPALDLIGHVVSRTERAATSANPSPAEVKMDTAALDRIVGSIGEKNGGVYKYTIGRDDLKIKEMGALINARMGLNTWAAFYGTDEDSIVAGDVAMLEGEVQPVLKALRGSGLEVVALHHHMIGAKPVIFFLHYFGKGPAANLATGFKAALDQLGKGKSGMKRMD
jgi:hypothetical protein